MELVLKDQLLEQQPVMMEMHVLSTFVKMENVNLLQSLVHPTIHANNSDAIKIVVALHSIIQYLVLQLMELLTSVKITSVLIEHVKKSSQPLLAMMITHVLMINVSLKLVNVSTLQMIY